MPVKFTSKGKHSFSKVNIFYQTCRYFFEFPVTIFTYLKFKMFFLFIIYHSIIALQCGIKISAVQQSESAIYPFCF